MINVIVELSKYVILTLMVVYTFHCFLYGEDRQESGRRGRCITAAAADADFLYGFYSVSGHLPEDRQISALILFYVEMMALFCTESRFCTGSSYKKASLLAAEQYVYAVKHWIYYAVPTGLSSHAIKQLADRRSGSVWCPLLIPVMIRKMKFLRILPGYMQELVLCCLAAVCVAGKHQLWGKAVPAWGFQPSEAIKIPFVFFMAALFMKRCKSVRR